MNKNENIILELKNVSVHFYVDEGILKAVDGVDLKIKKGKTLGIVGESGCGKTVLAYAILKIKPATARIGGEILLYPSKKRVINEKPIDIAKLDSQGKDIRDIRGGEIAMIFQEPMQAFSLVHTIGNQIIEAILLHITKDLVKARKLVLDILKKVGMSNAEQRMSEYPQQLSGGMRQRAMIAMALSCNPSILIADEPTTALDVTVQAMILELINELKKSFGSSIIFITHNLGVIAEMSDEVAVMYLGKVMEYADVDTIYHGALHPYTTALLNSIPSISKTVESKLETIEGSVPFPINLPKGCSFYPRCKKAQDGLCNVEDIPMIKIREGHQVRCVRVQNECSKGVI
ncbi:Oligopeptide transport ATP-binding protein OppD [subsurface metagenome]